MTDITIGYELYWIVLTLRFENQLGTNQYGELK